LRAEFALGSVAIPLTLHYRLALDPSMINGEGGVAAYAMNADGSLNQLGTARLPFNVRTGG
jgi:hypothetical protein